MTKKTYMQPLAIIALILVCLLAYGVLTMRDQRSMTEKVGDAIHDLPQGVDKAARQLEDRTPGQKLGDDIKDTGEKAGDKVKENTNP